MTLPDERYRAVVETEKFLRNLLSTPRVPKAVKEQARWCLRHYPNVWDMDQATHTSPQVFAKSIEDVQRMFMHYEQSKKDENKTSQ